VTDIDVSRLDIIRASSHQKSIRQEREVGHKVFCKTCGHILSIYSISKREVVRQKNIHPKGWMKNVLK